MGFIQPREFAFNEDEQTTFEGIMVPSDEFYLLMGELPRVRLSKLTSALLLILNRKEKKNSVVLKNLHLQKIKP